MKNRFIVSAVIFIVLCSAKIFFPENAAKVKNVVIPAITREVNVRDDCIAIGRAISGEENDVSVWERLTGREKAVVPSPSEAAEIPKAEATETPKVEATEAPKAEAVATGEFSLSDMVSMNLRGYEDLAGLPSQSPSPEASASVTPTPESTASPAVETVAVKPVEPSKAPTVSNVVSTTAPVAPDTLPVESTAPVFDPSEKVEEFLEEQAAFSDYSVPANVSYEAPAIPFEYSDPCDNVVSSGFGFREHPLDGGVKFHYGTDIGVIDGTDVKAFADGKVLSVQELDGYGNTVLIEHKGGFSSFYAHCSQILVDQGDTVKRGDKIALSGHSGKVTGPHLHFELIYNGKYLNPEFYLK